MTGTQVVRNTLLFLATIAFAYILVLSYKVIIGLLIAILLASALRPLVVRLQRWRVPQGLAILLVYGVLGLLSVGLIGAVLPPVVNQFAGYLQNEDRLANRIILAQNYVEQMLTQVTGSEVDVGLEPEAIREEVAQAVNQIRRTAPDFVDDIGAFLGDFILILVMGIYWMGSRERGLTYLTRFFSIGRREQVRLIIDEIELGLGAYMRGLVLVSVVVGLLSFTILALLRVPNAAALSFFYAVATAIPIIGGLVGVAIATFLALLSSPIHALAVLVVTTLLQQVENYYLTPRMMSQSVDLDPILVIVFVSVGFALDGITGALLAIPVSGTVTILLRHFVFEPQIAKADPIRIGGGVLLTTNETDESP
jgi:predicted PurR-regulated permease PerM